MASGIFAVAPYIGFLAPVAALSLGLPFVIVGAVFSAVVIALSCAAVSKNNTISEREAVVRAQEQEISKQKARLAENNTKLFDKQEQLPKEEVNRLDYLDLATSSRKQANSLDYLNIDNVSKQFDLSNIEAAKEYLKSL